MGATRQGWKATLRAALAVVLLAVTMGLAADAGASPSAAGSPGQAPGRDDLAPANPPAVLPASGRWTVTLITGDVLEVSADAEGRVTARPKDDRGSARVVQMPDGELYFIPLSVTPLVDQVLDRELFNVTGLVRQGYDDEHHDAVPLIVQRPPGVDVATTLSTNPDETPLRSIGAVATEVPKGDAAATGALLEELAADFEPHAESAGGITKVWLDRQVTTLSTPPAPTASADARHQANQPALDPNLPQVGADRAWAAGYTGEGVTVAVLDTGVDATHPDLAGKVVDEENFSAAEDVVDHFGHGTHVAGIAVGSGAGAPGARSGVAPGARLISGKVVDDEGFGAESEAIAGMEWAAPQADVINMSLGYGADSDGSDPLSQAVDALTEQHDTLFVIAAGNSGPPSRSVDFPGAADRALTVGAVDTSDALAEFSSRGPLVRSFELKPEIVAPGVDIVAARAAGTQMGEPLDDLYVRASGTSMATPHAAGAAAVLTQQHPDWSAGEIKASLVAAADPLAADPLAADPLAADPLAADPLDAGTYDVGAGRLDVGDGVETVVRPGQDVIDPSLPDPRTGPHTETVTWTNTGTEAQTVGLTATLEDRRGEPVDAVSVSPTTVTLAPGETGTATLTVDGPTLDPGLYGGAVVADPAGGPAHDDQRTPLGVHAAPASAELTIESTAPEGAAGPPNTFATIVNLDDFALYGDFLLFEDTATVTVPHGHYAVVGDVSSQDDDANVVAQVGDPDVEIAGDTAVAFDGAGAVPLHPTVSGVDTAPPMHTTSELFITPAAGAGGYSLNVVALTDHPTPALRLTPMDGDPASFAARHAYRLQAQPLRVRTGRDEIDAVSAQVHGPLSEPGERRYTAVDAGDGGDLTPSAGELAVVALPADHLERAAVVQRALDAGVALLAFVDEQRSHLTLDGFDTVTWAPDVPVLAAGGESASSLLAAAARGGTVRVGVAASPYTYDIAGPMESTVNPEPVVSRAEQRRMARIDQRFHSDADGTGATSEWRYDLNSLIFARTQGPLPQRRTDYVTPDFNWSSVALGHGFVRLDGELREFDDNPLSIDLGRTYDPRSRTTTHWVSRPQWPGPVGDVPWSGWPCQPTPVRRVAGTLEVWLAPFQSDPDGFGCSDPHTARLTVTRDGTVLGTVDANFGEFALPDEPGTYRLSYEQTGFGPYEHRSSTAWTFRSGEDAFVPLLVVDYDLPLDTLNRPTGRTATFTVDQMTGAADARVTSLDVWTSSDDGATWTEAHVQSRGDGEFRVRLPRAARGTPMSLRVDARDADGNRIEQTLHAAYTA